MKKYFIICAAALVAMAACSKVETVAPAASEITFKTLAVSTKALINPDGTAPAEDAFPATEKFSVFGYAGADAESIDYATPLMNNVTIAKIAGDWKAETGGPYLWPATGLAEFYAAYPAGAAAFDATAKKLSFTGMNLGSVIGTQTDPLVAVANGLSCAAKPTVPIVFKHITSQVVVMAYDATKTASIQGNIQIKKVEFINMNTQGDYLDGTTAGKGQWSNQNGVSTIEVFSGAEYLPVGIANESILSGGTFATAIDNSAAFVTVPSDLTAGKQQVKVTFSVRAYTINGYTYPAVADKTETIDLYDFNNNHEFACGKRYIYHIGISLDGANNEIMFAPTVLGWEDENIDGIVIDAVNGGLVI